MGHIWAAVVAAGVAGGGGTYYFAHGLDPRLVVAEAQGQLLEQFSQVLERAEERVVNQIDERLYDQVTRIDRLESRLHDGLREVHERLAVVRADLGKLQGTLQAQAEAGED